MRALIEKAVSKVEAIQPFIALAVMVARKAEGAGGEQHTEVQYALLCGTFNPVSFLPFAAGGIGKFAHQAAPAVEHKDRGVTAAHRHVRAAKHEGHGAFAFYLYPPVAAPVLHALIRQSRSDEGECGYVC